MSIKIEHKKGKIGLLTPCVIEVAYKTVNTIMLFKELEEQEELRRKTLIRVSLDIL